MAETKGRSHGQKSAQPSRRLVAIMFTDLVGYSAMAHRDEALAIELLELHRAWVREILPSYGGREIETVGDAFLIEFAGALAAVECAVAIQRRFAEYNAAATPDRRMELRVGIHLGDVEHKGDKVMGDGVNIASRIHGMAKPGGICVSEDVHHAVRNRPAFQFTSLGVPPLKNIATPLELFELAPSQKLAPPAEVATVKVAAAKRERRWMPAAAAAGGFALVAAAAIAWFVLQPAPKGLPAIAVLPFDNLSADPDSAFFTDGLHDTVIGHLSRVAGLKVISRTSVMAYRGQHSNLRQIAKDLGVTEILEGSVQRAGTKLRVAAQLIDTATDTHLWSNEYDRELSDVFAVQADIAEQVAKAVQVKLTPQEQASIQSVPTQNAAAYDLYLRAVLVERKANPTGAELLQGVAWLDQAVALDPHFAHAYALMANLDDTLNWMGHDSSDERRRQVGVNADKATQLDPKLAEAHIAKALDLYHGSRNYDAALRELQLARTLAPGNAQVLYWMGPIYRRQARWDEALATLQQAAALDPLNPAFLGEYAGTLQQVRRYAESAVVFDRVMRLQGNDPMMAIIAAYTRFLDSGDLAQVDKALDAVPAGFNPDCAITGFRAGTLMLERRFDAAVAAVRLCDQKEVIGGSGEQRLPRDLFEAQPRWFASGGKDATLARKVKPDLERILAARPDQPGTRLSLAFVLVMLGERQRAIEEADRALASMPLSRDALAGAGILVGAAQVHANTGLPERALGELEQSLKLPGGANVQELKLDPAWDPLRKDPRFQQLLDQYLPKRT